MEWLEQQTFFSHSLEAVRSKIKVVGEKKSSPMKPPSLHYTRGYKISGASLVAQTVKNLPAVW